ncbi:pyridoxal phosphate-dependent aminotransferase [Cognatishimia sp. SS12]|uniref:pyridoxal phosphate-dependent aminotransferase n=1 Tax=Cognatishimia sp. SS12 TaxID=2979465 RepID=UPI0023311D29|nr:pyridoxal phosphate-dependent aminotransferase [Cognatishimia sp. SS12]MDC0739668.1 pyridoxal phosphate-dependent aminotransferase [Cognatishimia sp. SS12]
MTGPRYTALVNALPATVPFVGPETQERATGRKFTARLGANENGFGASPKALDALRSASAGQWMYGDPENHDLRHALAAFHDVLPENIVVGEGIDGLLGYLARMLIEPGDRVVTSAGAYPTFNYHVAGFGGQIETVPYAGMHEDLPALIARAKEVDAKLIYFANPDNPMGSWRKGAEITALLDSVPDGCLLVLDEAYVELAPEGTAAAYPVAHPKVIRMRTFSKGYGLAGARIGYAMGAPELIQNFDKIRNHFGVNRASQAAALAALADQDWLRKLRADISAARAEITRIGAENGLTALPSATNFVTLDCHRDADFAKALLAALAEQGVFARMPFVAPHNQCIRISCGRAEDLRILQDALPKALAAVAA